MWNRKSTEIINALNGCYERSIDFYTLKITLLGDPGYALAGYEY